ncbi:MAG: N,N'-diacetyllegionaminic acid synthase [Candidatus Hinthialibacteria bacterium OLB16]|nr:MAG: N,N'-diacetyllegionaminic acid synthase [Candidatus Hinthialibacteria bacterium OLB16]
MKTLSIDGRMIGEGHPCYIIAEIGLNHNGQLHLAKALVDIARQAGVDAVKFQKRSLKDLYREELLEDPSRGEKGYQYLIPYLQEFELSEADFREVARYCREQGITFLCTAWDRASADFLTDLQVPAFKVASADLTNFDLLEHLLQKGKPLLLSTGMSTEPEIEETVRFLSSSQAPFALLHCNSTYPAPFRNLNLRYLQHLQNKFDVPIGYSGHEKGISVSVVAVSLGAQIIERHLTLDRTLRGPDHASSLEPQGLSRLVRDIRNVEEAMGQPRKWMTRGEMMNRTVLGKSLVAAQDLRAGTTLERSMIAAKSPGKGLSPQRLPDLVGVRITRDIRRDEEFIESDLGKHTFNRALNLPSGCRWGVIVRFNDLDTLVHPDLAAVEFHLSDRDLQMGIPKDMGVYPQEVVLHMPEYWGSILLDGCTTQAEVLSTTRDVWKRLADLGRAIRPHFKGNRDKPVKLVIHGGGWSQVIPLDVDRRWQLYERLAASLAEIDKTDVEVLVENMPPLPWFFSEEWFSNVFLEAELIERFCRQHGYRIVLDTSHAGLYCNHAGLDLNEYIQRLWPLVRYVHISDAVGVDGEGLQIGEGTIDFRPLGELLKQSDMVVATEIWQGHKYGGEGYYRAIERLAAIWGLENGKG